MDRVKHLDHESDPEEWDRACFDPHIHETDGEFLDRIGLSVDLSTMSVSLGSKPGIKTSDVSVTSPST